MINRLFHLLFFILNLIFDLKTITWGYTSNDLEMKKLMIGVMLFGAIACTKTKIPFESEVECDVEITYTNEAMEIIGKSCAYSGCHNGTAPGDFNTYAGIESYLLDNKFATRTLQLQDMPPSYAPADKPQQLTQDELEILDCWAQGGYKE